MKKPNYKKTIIVLFVMAIFISPVIILHAENKVAILKSADTPDFNAVRNGFMSVFFEEFEEFDCQNDINTAKRRMAIISSENFSAILAIGTIAAQAAIEDKPQGLILATMVQNPDTLSSEAVNLSVIGMYPPLDSMFDKIKSLNVANLGILLNPDENGQYLERLRVAASRKNINIISQEVNSPRLVPAVFQQIQDQIDAFMFLTDSIYSMKDSIDFILQTCTQGKIVTIAPTSSLVAQGAFLSISSDYVEIGRMAGQMIMDHFSNKRLPLFREPSSVLISYNEKTARSLGIVIPQEIERDAKEVIR